MAKDYLQKVTIRIPLELHGRLLGEARKRQVRLSDYLRACLDRGHAADLLEDQLAELRYLTQELQQLRSETSGGARGASNPPGGSVGEAEFRQVVRAELAPIRKAVASSRGSSAEEAPGLTEAQAGELLKSTFTVEALMRELLAGRNPTAIRSAQQKATKRLDELGSRGKA